MWHKELCGADFTTMTFPKTIRSPKREEMIATGRAHQAARDLRSLLAEGRGGALARVTLVRR